MKLNAGIDIPEGWQFLPLKRITRLGYGEALASDEREQGGVQVYGSNGPFDEHSAANTLAPCIVVGRKGSFGKLNYSDDPVFAVDTTFIIDRHHTSADLRFIYYLLSILGLDELSDDTAVPGLSREKAYQALSPFPPLDTQRRIARFLDEKTARIDGLIEKKRALLDRLAEKRQALITRAVTKGLNPDVPLKPSGIDWLGDIPDHWEVKRIKHLSRILRGKFSYRPRNAPHLYDGKYPFIQTGDVARAEKYIDMYSQTLSDEGYLVSKEFPENTLCMAIAANIGDVAILRFRACFPDSVVGRSRYAEKGPKARSNLKCNLIPSQARDHSAKNHEVTWQ